MIDPDEMVDMCYDFLSFARRQQIKVVLFKIKDRHLQHYLKNALCDQDFAAHALSADYNSRGEMYFPVSVDIPASYT